MSDINIFILVLAHSFSCYVIVPLRKFLRRKVVKKNLKIALSSIILISLVSCGAVTKPSSTINDDSSADSSVEEPSSVDSSEETSSLESSNEESSIPSSSSEISSSEILSSSEQSSLPSSSSEETSSSSEEVSSSDPDSSSSWSTPEGYFHVIFLNYDDSLLYEVDVEEGHEAIYLGETPIKPEDDEFIYEFKGWDQDLTNILSNVTTKAEYSYTAKENWGSIIWF